MGVVRDSPQHLIIGGNVYILRSDPFFPRPPPPPVSPFPHLFFLEGDHVSPLGVVDAFSGAADLEVGLLGLELLLQRLPLVQRHLLFLLFLLRLLLLPLPDLLSRLLCRLLGLV